MFQIFAFRSVSRLVNYSLHLFRPCFIREVVLFESLGGLAAEERCRGVTRLNRASLDRLDLAGFYGDTKGIQALAAASSIFLREQPEPL